MAVCKDSLSASHSVSVQWAACPVLDGTDLMSPTHDPGSPSVLLGQGDLPSQFTQG